MVSHQCRIRYSQHSTWETSRRFLPELEDLATVLLGNVVGDVELSALRARDARIKQRVKQLRVDGKLDRKEENAELERQRADAFSPRERELLQKGVSNQEYHYLGSAKIMARIGQGFAEALVNGALVTGVKR